MDGIYLLLGTNLGNRIENLEKAKNLLNQGNISIKKSSSIYQTAAWGKTDQQDFLNQVIKIETNVDPLRLLELCLQIEHTIGRIRQDKWGERIIDIDLLFYHNKIMEIPKLVIPHPAIQDRMFTLKPLAEIAGEEIHPVLNDTINTLVKKCIDPLAVEHFK